MHIKLRYFFTGIITLLSFYSLLATHIVGGEMYYDKIGTDSYRVTLKVYRDCFNGQAPFDGQANGAPAYLHVFDNFGTLIQQIDLGPPVVTPVPPSINNPCIQTPNSVCVEEGKYTYVLTLPPKTGGYHLVYQRCCRNNTILNLTNPGGTGSTYKTFIPGPELAVNNSSPRYDNFPPIFICNGISVKFDHKATDPDGDVLVYSLCDPYNGLDGCCPSIGTFGPNTGPSCPTPPPSCPTVASPPPYPLVNFITPYSGFYPISSNPSITINSSTGFLTGMPNLNGQWVVNVCVQEFRNNQLLSTHYRDFQFNVVTCSVTVLSAVAEQASKCMGDSITFNNQSIGATTYHWDFGVAEIFSDTSNIKNPTFIYPDTGVYNVTLIANPGKPCADTISKPFYIYPRIDVNFLPPQIGCVKNNNYNFSVNGTYINNATFNWNFGSAATPSTSVIKTPSNIVFNSPGKYFIKLIAKQYTCIDSFIDTVRILDRPKAIISNFPTSLCDPASVAFSNGSITEYGAGYVWETSDGKTYNSFEASHVFSPPGVYSVSLTLIRNLPCPDTSKTSINSITVNPTPVADFVFSPTITTIFDPEIFFENNSSTDAITFDYDFGDGATSVYMNEKHSYYKHGTYPVRLKIKNRFDCENQITKDVKILPEFRFWVPNTFTPDDNGLNDVFMPITVGVLDYSFELFDRWGEKIFSTNDPMVGWDGKRKGKKCKQDVYVWKISFKNEVDLRYYHKTGHVLLLNDEGN